MTFVVLFSVFAFGVIHSLTAGQVKAWFRERFGDRAYYGLYRVFYNILSLIILAPISLLFSLSPGGIVWNIDLKYEPVLLTIQAIGLIGLVVSLVQIDLGRFIGITQFFAYMCGTPLPLPDEKLQTNGLYRFVRHPLYFFSILAIWPVTTMTEAYLGFCIGATLYFIIGSIYEERRLVHYFGTEYEEYRHRVPRLIPFLQFGNKT